MIKFSELNSIEGMTTWE